jgi:polyisoprenoid-binding protein YceI
MNTLLRFTLASAFLTVAALSVSAASFDFKDPKGVNNVQFHLDAPLESISGSGTGVSGTVNFDPANPGATTGNIVLATASLTVGNPMMKDHLLGAKWLDVAKFPEISFVATGLSKVQTTGDVTKAEVTGKLTIKDVTKEVSAPVTLTYLPGKLGARVGKPELKGDLLVLRASFSIKRSDFNINAGQNTDKVSETIELNLSLAGASPR